MAYFGSFTVFHLKLASGALLKVSMANTQRHRDTTSPGATRCGRTGPLGPCGADAMKRPLRPDQRDEPPPALFSGRGLVIGVPYAFLLLFFLLPFLIVGRKISVSEMDNVSSRT
jgi:hypothetical protein